MKRASNAATVMLLAVLSTVLSAGLYGYLRYRTVSETDMVVVARNEAAVLSANRIKGDDIMAEYQATESARAKLPGFFVPSDDAVAFIRTAESVGLASGAKVSISSINAPHSLAPGAVGKISIQVAVDGSWPAVMRALELFEVLPYKSSIDEANWNASSVTDKAGDKRSWNASLTITAYTLASTTSINP